jgi:hypothetical protein
LTVFCPTRLVADLIEEALPGFRARSVEAATKAAALAYRIDLADYERSSGDLVAEGSK